MIPNLTHPDAPTGGEDDANELSFGKTPKREFRLYPAGSSWNWAKNTICSISKVAHEWPVPDSTSCTTPPCGSILALQQFAISFLTEQGLHTGDHSRLGADPVSCRASVLPRADRKRRSTASKIPN